MNWKSSFLWYIDRWGQGKDFHSLIQMVNTFQYYMLTIGYEVKKKVLYKYLYSNYYGPLGNPLQCSCRRIPGVVEPGGLLSMGWHRIRHDWSDLAAAAAAWGFRASQEALVEKKKKKRKQKTSPPKQETQETWVWSMGQEDTWRRAWQPTPVFLPGESMNRAWLSTVQRVAKSRTWLTWLSLHARMGLLLHESSPHFTYEKYGSQRLYMAKLGSQLASHVVSQ